MFTISLCMIVKNEEDCLDRVLNCAKKFADEIIIVDTGSADKTIEIAKSFTDKVFQFKWFDDFSMARNFAFSKATSDYQMWLDADDIVTDENIKKINLLKNSNLDADVFMCKYSMNFDDDNRPRLSFYRERILKRTKNFKWQGVVHEVIVPEGKIFQTDIEIEHRKIHPTLEKRNLLIYENALKNGKKFNAREQYYYSRELFYNFRLKDAEKNLKKFLKMNGYPPDDYDAHLLLSEIFVAQGDFLAGRDILIDCLKKHPPESELFCKLGYVCENLNDLESAIFFFKSALLCPPKKEGFVHEEYQEFVPNLELSRLYYQIDKKIAKNYHENAKKCRPNNEMIKFNEKFFKN